jgi:hypothetical protein
MRKDDRNLGLADPRDLFTENPPVSYYDRQTATHVDGTPIFKSREDEQSERTVAEQLESAWRCQCRSFGRLSPVDWFFVQDGRLVGIGELKTTVKSRNDIEPIIEVPIDQMRALTPGTDSQGPAT